MFRGPGKSIAAALLLALLATGCADKSESDAIAEAKTRLAKRDYAGAVIELKTALQKTPNAAEARYLMGVALLEQGEAGAAAVELGKADEAGYNDELVAPKLARAWVAAGRLKELLQVYGKTSLNQPQAQAELRTAVAVAHARLGHSADARTAVDDALKSDPKYPWALLTKARILAASGMFDEALTVAGQAIAPGEPGGEAHLLRGSILRLAKNDVAGATKAFQQAALDPQTVLPARASLIQIEMGQGRIAAARAQLEELRKTHAKHPHTHYMDALVSYAAKDYARTEEIIEQLLRVAPDNPQLLVLGGAANLQRGSLIAAETKLGKIVQTVERMPVARKMLAETYLRMGHPDKALGTLRPMLEQAQPDGDALSLAGQAHLHAGRPQEAESYFAAAARIKPRDVQVKTALALTELVKGNADAAFEALQEIASKDAGDAADLALISAHMRRREYDAALAAIALLEKKQPSKPSAKHLRGLALRGKGDATGAREAFESALKLDQGHFASIAALASLDMADSQPGRARQRLESAIRSDPKNTAARILLLDVMARDNARPEALMAVIDEAVKAAPSESGPRVAKIVQLTSMNDVKGAAAAALDAIAALPNSPEVLDAAGRALSSAGDDQQAISAFNRLASVASRSPVPYLRLADVHAKRGDPAAVALNLGRAYEAAPESKEVHRRLLAHAVRTKDFRPVLTSARDLQKRAPGSASGFILEGDAEAARKAWGPALAAYRGALGKADPEGRPARQVYAALRSSGNAPGAERFVADWLKSNPRDMVLREHLANEAILKKDYPTAERYLREMLELQPRNGAALNNLAWLLAERGDKSAVEMAERAVSAAPHAAPAMDTLAKALASQQQWDRAIEMQKKAVASMPDREVYRLNLAQLYAKAGRRAEALTEVQALSKLGDKFRFQGELAELRKTLGN